MKRALWLIIAVAGLAALSNSASVQSTPSPSGQKATDVASRQARSVKDQVLTSQEMPAVRIEFDKGFKYAGGHSFILYEVANAEQHFFVDADKEGRVKRMYWVQFEGYLPSNTHTYRYKVNKTANIGGLEFIFLCARYSTHKRFVLGGEEFAAPFSSKTVVAYWADGCSHVDKGEIDTSRWRRPGTQVHHGRVQSRL
jgi:hypothetical protein